MTDLEITKLCAEAMGVKIMEPTAIQQAFGLRGVFVLEDCPEVVYNPLHDDAQAMALVKKLNLNIIKSDDEWWVHESPHICDYYGATDYGVYDKDLRRAICLCVAKMGEAK